MPDPADLAPRTLEAGLGDHLEGEVNRPDSRTGIDQSPGVPAGSAPEIEDSGPAQRRTKPTPHGWLFESDQRKMLAEVLRSSFCGRLTGSWDDPGTDAGIAWVAVEKATGAA